MACSKDNRVTRLGGGGLVSVRPRAAQALRKCFEPSSGSRVFRASVFQTLVSKSFVHAASLREVGLLPLTRVA